MSRRKAPAGSYAVDIEPLSDNDEGIMPTPDSGTENKDPTGKKKPGGSKAAAPTANTSKSKPSKPRRRRASGVNVLGPKRAAASKKTKATSKRPALKEKEIPNTQPETGNDTEDVDDFDDLAIAQDPGSGGHMPTPASVTRQSAKKPDLAQKPEDEKPKGRREKIRNSIEEIPETQQVVTASSNMSKAPSKRPRKPKPAKHETIPETQPEPMDVDPSQVEDDLQQNDMRPPSKDKSRPRTRAPSAQRRRAGSISDTERVGKDTALKRKYNDMMRKFENLQAKYDTLRDVGIVEAQSNFQKLKKQTDESTQAADDAISFLHSQLATKEADILQNASLSTQNSSLSSENTSLNAENKTLQADNRALHAENKNISSEKSSLKLSLQTAQSEIKALKAKLAATRQASETIGKNVPNSSAKPHSGPGVKLNVQGGAEAAKDAQKRVLKEELYGDLTGLIIRDIKHREDDGEDVYDCIQTGRNGTLHFHLTLANPPPLGTSYDEVELAYEPLLDDSRDAPLLELLPDYLKEEICFPRKQAAMFYRRITECMMKRTSLPKEGGMCDEDEVDVEEDGAIGAMEE